MTDDSIAIRFIKTMKSNGLNQELIEEYMGVSQATISNMKRGKVVKKYENFDRMISLCKNDDQKFYVATGKHLPKPTQAETHIPPNLAGFHDHMLKAMIDLTKEIKGLKEAITHQQEAITQQGEILSHLKIPEP